MSRDHSGDAWFRLGRFDVSSTVLLVIIGAIGVVVSAFVPALVQGGHFSPQLVLQGEVWRSFTWPFVAGPDLWTILTLAMLWYFGRDLENQIGRRPMMSLYIALWALLTSVSFVVGLALGGGLMAGLRPIVLERGKCAEERKADVRRFWTGGALDPESNAMFGEGGAGAFSDGKLTTRIKDPLCDEVLRTLVRFGAPADTAVEAKPHIGTDKLTGIISAIRMEIERLGGEVRFGTALGGLVCADGRLVAVRAKTASGEETITCSACVLAVGQNADDTYRMLFAAGLEMTAKPYAVGVRIEHPRELIDRSQYGAHMDNPRLGAAEYRFADRSGDRGVYTFCMCPGGKVIACSNEDGRVIVNGMSEHARNARNSNAAIVVQVDEKDFPQGPLGGLAFREKLERAAFVAGGSGYKAPASTLGAFLAGVRPYGWGAVESSYAPGVTLCDLNALLPVLLAQGIRDAALAFGRKLRGFDMDDAVLTAIESRTSAPVRIVRDELGQATRVKGLYPCGEGAGYAGGIVSAAVDGMRAAERIMALYAPLLQQS